jgi:chlorobactene glucosyltransferase
MILYYHIAILGLLGIMALIVIVNMISFRSVRRDLKPALEPPLSVLLPARNEERNIGTCLATLVEQDYSDFEILVLDDNSDDGTAEIVEEWTRIDPRIRLIRGKQLPPGWTGKSYACHQLSEHARGHYLLFIDADTVHLRQSFTAAMHAMEENLADLLTVIPLQVMGTFWERVILPLLHFTTFAFLPFPLVRLTRSPKLAMANGQFMLFRRGPYEEIGGHAAVRSALVEDVWLSRLIKERGFALRIMGGEEIVSCRMYSSLREIWDGFSKNLFPGFRYSVPGILAVIVFNIATSILPFLFLAAGMAMSLTGEPWYALVAAQTSLLLLIRLLLSVRFDLSILSSLLHPLAMGVFSAIAVNSCWWVLRGRGSRWKGRSYDFRHDPATQ